MTHSLLTGLDLFDLKNFKLATLVVESEALRGNPLGDPTSRRSPMLVPKAHALDEFPVVLHLSGFTGNGPKSFNVQTFERGLPLLLDDATSEGVAPLALHVFVDAMTSWGGSQFIDSNGMGRYGQYVAREIPTAITNAFPNVSADPGRWCVTGGSSGGYGAIELATGNPDRFGVFAAIAPDSFFEASLIHEIRTALPMIEKLGGVKVVMSELKTGKLSKRKDWHTILNAIAMGLCYAPDGNGGVRWPIDSRTGELKQEVWNDWYEHDPLCFLPKRIDAIKKLSAAYLDCGTRDQFHLQYGTRQMSDIFSRSGIAFTSSEFDGTHFDIGERRPEVWNWLASIWR